MTAFPRAIKVGTATYRIEWHDEIIDTQTGEQRLGECDHLHSVIRLARYLETGKRWSVLMHEVLHAIDWIYGGGRLSEKLVGWLDETLAAALIDSGIISVEPLTDELEGDRQRSIAHMEQSHRNVKAA